MRPAPPDLRTLTVLGGLVQWVKLRYRTAAPRLHAVGKGGLTACRVAIPSHAVYTPTPNARPCGNCASHLTGVWRTGRPRLTPEQGGAQLPDLSTTDGRQELLDAPVEELALALGVRRAFVAYLPPEVQTGRDLMLTPLGADDPFGSHGHRAPVLRRAYARFAGLPVPCDPDALDAWVETGAVPPGTPRARTRG